jgi:hypothetical protein
VLTALYLEIIELPQISEPTGQHPSDTKTTPSQPDFQCGVTNQ